MRDYVAEAAGELDALPMAIGLGSVLPYSRMLDLARRGLTLPESLTFEEVQSVCRTLIVQYAQIGIR